MCTVSWTCLDHGYEIFFSRDEQRSRIEGRPPQICNVRSAQYLAPHDPQGGGTWIWVNDHRMAACIMNAYDVRHNATGHEVRYASRGWLLAQLAASHSIAVFEEDARRHLKDRPHRPAYLLAWNKEGQAWRWVWDGRVLTQLGVPPQPMLSTSSYQPKRVLDARRQTFERIYRPGCVTDSEALERFHEAADVDPSAETVRMSRQDARTVSLTRLRVQGNVARMDYRARRNDETFARPLVAMLPLPEGTR